jgi:hypothetical protein
VFHMDEKCGGGNHHRALLGSDCYEVTDWVGNVVECASLVVIILLLTAQSASQCSNTVDPHLANRNSLGPRVIQISGLVKSAAKV